MTVENKKVTNLESGNIPVVKTSGQAGKNRLMMVRDHRRREGGRIDELIPSLGLMFLAETLPKGK